MSDPSSADVPKVPEEMSSQFSSALKRAREIAMKLQASSSSAHGTNNPPSDEPPRKMDANNEVDEKFLQAQLIAKTISQRHNIPSRATSDFYTEEEIISDSMLIPSTYVGLVIGKGGETIRNFQERSQCKMYMVQDGEYAKAPEKLLTFQGLKSRVEEAKRLVKEFLDDKDKSISGPPGSTKVEVTVPQDCVGLIIGKGGDTIKRISSETNCKVHFNPDSAVTKNGERICIFEGLPHDIQIAQQRVRDIVEMVLRKNAPQTMNIVLPEGSELFEVVVTASKAGMIVGRGGEFVQLIMQSTGAHVEFNKGVPDNGQTKTFLISGTKDQIDRARQMMVDKVGENHVNPLQPPTNVLVTYAPAQSAWGIDPYAAAGYDPNLYYQHYQQQQAMWSQATSAATTATTPSNTDAHTVDPNAASYYANMTQEEYAAAWATYYQQYQYSYANAAVDGTSIPVAESSSQLESNSNLNDAQNETKENSIGDYPTQDTHHEMKPTSESGSLSKDDNCANIHENHDELPPKDVN